MILVPGTRGRIYEDYTENTTGASTSLSEPALKVIDVFICKLRKKLANTSQGKNYIETVWGRGYVLREDPPPMRALAG
jgi:DNA-binding response OmpR family regulator